VYLCTESVSKFLLAVAATLIAASSTAWAAPKTGHDVFMQSGCFACHGEFGYGGAGPRFRNDQLLSADQYVIGQILLGRGIMPSFADRLNNEQIAAVATYIRNSWGNAYGPVSPDQVAKARMQFSQAAASQPNRGEQK
jgi:mono/diheme cytochrome c family protein